MSRSVASPDAETPSYCPVFIRVTISSELLPTFAFTLQLVAFSNGCTQSTVLSSEPSSAYPAHTMMFSAPSPLPSALSIDSLGGAAREPLAPADELDLDELHELMSNTTLAAIAVRPKTFGCRMGTPSSLKRRPRAGCPRNSLPRTRDQAATPEPPVVRGKPAHRTTRSRGFAAARQVRRRR